MASHTCRSSTSLCRGRSAPCANGCRAKPDAVGGDRRTPAGRRPAGAAASRLAGLDLRADRRRSRHLARDFAPSRLSRSFGQRGEDVLLADAALRAVCDSAEENLELLIAVRSQTDAIFHEDEPEEAMTRSVFTEPLERLLRDGTLDGSLRTLDPVETATLLFNLVGWTYIHMRTGHGWTPDHARQATVDIALRGVADR